MQLALPVGSGLSHWATKLQRRRRMSVFGVVAGRWSLYGCQYVAKVDCAGIVDLTSRCR